MMDLVVQNQLRVAVKVLHYAFPALVFFYFGIAHAVTICTLQTQNLRVQDQKVRRGVIIALILAVAGTYIIEGIVVAIKSRQVSEWYPEQDRVFYLISSGIIFGIEVLALTDTKFPVWYPYYGTWFIAILVEIAFLILPNLLRSPSSKYDYIFVATQILRLSGFVTLPALYFVLRNDEKSYDETDTERQALLSKKLGPKTTGSGETASSENRYGTTTESAAQESNAADKSSDEDSEDSWLAAQRKAHELIAKRLKQDGNWFTYLKGFFIFFPYVWPFNNKMLQFRAVLVGGCLLASNALHVLVPRQMGIMIDSLSGHIKGDDTGNIWLPITIYAALLFVSGGACIGWLRSWLWLPLEQYSYEAIKTASHAHVMSLSSDFHDNKSNSDVVTAIDGGKGVTSLLETVCFEVLPMFIDLAIAFAYLWSLFGPFMGLALLSTSFSYLYITTKLVAMRAENKRRYVTCYRKEWRVGYQSLDGWTTASLFNRIPYERHKYGCAVKDHLKASWVYDLSIQSMSAAQGLVMTCGMLGALWIAASQVINDSKSIGQFSTFLVYWSQLQAPLVFFGGMYRNISYTLMDAERLLQLFQTKPTIIDSPNAKPLKLDKGEVKFDNVSFAYDERKPTLKNVSFAVPAGKTVALVGETGGGKSTILKLIDRFYDVKNGSISIDGQDVRSVTLSSLRERIAVVPQDPILFRDSIMNNIRYAKLTATDKEVHEACKAAAVHDKIMTFPDGYSSLVGERGVKLSGGEKQRVAIARALLKESDIILLDEATSAVDTETEQLIQQGLKTLCKGRTTFIVAHRLSTIMRADRILVVMEGEIVEEGNHFQLIRARGKYHDLWSKQIFVEPSKERSRSPRKANNNLINDLDPVQSTAAPGNDMKAKTHVKSAPETVSSLNPQEGKYVERHGGPVDGIALDTTLPNGPVGQPLLSLNSREGGNPEFHGAPDLSLNPQEGECHGAESCGGSVNEQTSLRPEGSHLNPQAPIFLAREYDRFNEGTRWKFKTGEDAAIMKNLTEKVKDGWLQEAEEKRDQNLVKVAEKIQKIEATTKDPVKAAAKIERLQYKEAEKHKKNLRGKNLNSASDVPKIGRELDPAEDISIRSAYKDIVAAYKRAGVPDSPLNVLLAEEIEQYGSPKGKENRYEQTNESSAAYNARGGKRIISPHLYKRQGRNSRRQIAKNEPMPLVMDGAQDSDPCVERSGEGQPVTENTTVPAVQLRHVSAPSDPPQRCHNSSSVNRNRRSRHWRAKKRAAEISGPSTVASSTTTSGGTSVGSVDDTRSHPAPASTPAEGVPHSATITFSSGS